MTAAMIALNAAAQESPPSQAVLTTTRDWISDDLLRYGWKSIRRRVHREVRERPQYAWFREWTEGRSDGVRRTHYHSIWCGLSDEEGREVARISREVFSELAGAYSERAHGSQPIWDAGGLARYVAGLVGHHLKEGQAPPPGWLGRRFATSKGFYAIAAVELRSRAKAVVRDERLEHALTVSVLESCVDRLPEFILDEAVTARLGELASLPAPRVMSRSKAARLLGRRVPSFEGSRCLAS